MQRVLGDRRHRDAELGEDRDGEVGRNLPHQPRRGRAPSDRAAQPPQGATAAPGGEQPVRRGHVLTGEQHRGDLEAAGRAHQLQRRPGARLLLHLHQVGPLVPQQRREGPAGVAQPVGPAGARHRDGKDFDAPLALPADLERAPQPRLAPALRHADGDVEVAGGERAQLSPVGGVDVGRGDDENAAHENQLRIANCGLRI